MMFSIYDRPSKLCDGLTRRELLRVGGLSAAGLSLPALLHATEGRGPLAAPGTGGPPIGDPTFGKARNVIYVWLQGGPPQHETFDPKPFAPAEIRGAFKPIQTNVAGIQFCELLPRTARIADKLAVVRSLHTDNNIHSASGYHVLTGYKYQGPNARMISPKDWPWFGSIVKMMRPSEVLPPLSTVWIPRRMRLNENVTPAGQTAGFLGRQWDPDRFEGDPSAADYRIEGFARRDVAPLRLSNRMRLLAQVEQHFAEQDRGRAVGVYDKLQSQAFDLLTSGKVKEAFNVRREPQKLRQRYGLTKWGQSLLLARRLVQAGVRLVHVNWAREPGDSAVDNPMWDTHAQNADRLEDVLCPIFDVGFTALIGDLDQRGLLDETLVVAIGEFGRTPKINDKAGRDHWGPVFSFALAGAGIQPGQVHGASDKNGGYPAKDPVSPADLTATIFHLLGISHHAKFKDPERREHLATAGRPIKALLGIAERPPRAARPGGSISRVPPYDDSLLLNTGFEADVPLRPADFGSRPKGWRASPLLATTGGAGFGVKLVAGDSTRSLSGRNHLAVGLWCGREREDTGPVVSLPGNTRAIVAQEMRNPRLGRFEFSIRACCEASSQKFYEEVFLKHFKCRLTIYRYTELSRDPRLRQEFATDSFVPPLVSGGRPTAKSWKKFQVAKTLDSLKPGQNFPIGKGYGVGVIVEKNTPGTLKLAGEEPQFVVLRIDDTALSFSGRTINDKVKV